MAGKGKPFQKGQSGNPTGRRPGYTTEIRDALRENRATFTEELKKICFSTEVENSARLNDPKYPAIYKATVSILITAVNKSCEKRAAFLLDNLLAPIPKNIELSDADGKPIGPLANVPTEQLLTFFEALQSKKG